MIDLKMFCIQLTFLLCIVLKTHYSHLRSQNHQQPSLTQFVNNIHIISNIIPVYNKYIQKIIHIILPQMNTPTNQSQQQNNPYSSLNLQVRESRMYALMKDQVINFICNIFITFSDEELDNHDSIAKSIKMHMDKLYGPPWHCIVGKGYGSAVTYNNKNFAIMIFRH